MKKGGFTFLKWTHKVTNGILALNGGEVVRTELTGRREPIVRAKRIKFHPALTQIIEYLEGKRRKLDLSFTLRGTPFQKKVWKTLIKIPYGSTLSYSEIAEMIDNPGAARAVGRACNHNKLSIIIPCHRVIGKNGKLVGFGGGISIKKKLLSLERGGKWRSKMKKI